MVIVPKILESGLNGVQRRNLLGPLLTLLIIYHDVCQGSPKLKLNTNLIKDI